MRFMISVSCGHILMSAITKTTQICVQPESAPSPYR